MATIPSLSMCRKPWPSPTVVVVLPDPSGVGVMARHDDVLGPRAILQFVDRVERDLRRRVSVRFQQVGTDAHVGGDLVERATDRGT